MVNGRCLVQYVCASLFNPPVKLTQLFGTSRSCRQFACLRLLACDHKMEHHIYKVLLELKNVQRACSDSDGSHSESGILSLTGEKEN